MESELGLHNQWMFQQLRHILMKTSVDWNFHFKKRWLLFSSAVPLPLSRNVVTGQRDYTFISKTNILKKDIRQCMGQTERLSNQMKTRSKPYQYITDIHFHVIQSVCCILLSYLWTWQVYRSLFAGKVIEQRTLFYRFSLSNILHRHK